MSKKREVAILGGSGFVGMEMYRLLKDHPHVTVTFISSESLKGRPVEKHFRVLNGSNKELKFKSIHQLEPGYDAIFSCLPTGVLPNYISEVINKTDVIFNVSGDYRIKNHELLEKHYPKSLLSEHFLDSQYYIPEFHELNKKKKIINLPGCMAVASIYTLYPLIKSNLIEDRVIIDAKTGSSGGGKQTSEHPAERAHNFRPHKMHGHRHRPEITNTFYEMYGNNIDLQFSTHSLDLPRGIFITTYSRLKKDVTALDVKKTFFKEYENSTFIDYMKNTQGGRFQPMIKTVVGTNRAEVAVYIENSDCVSVCSLDNMIKGAAGQAVQAFNVYFDHSEDVGLNITNVGMWP